MTADPLPSRHPAAVLFDMDGTLVDSEKLWDVALHELAAEYGGTLSDAARKAMVGTSMAASMRLLHDDLGQPERDPQVSAAWIDARILELFRTGLRWRPGALTLLRAVRAAGIPPPWSPPAVGRWSRWRWTPWAGTASTRWSAATRWTPPSRTRSRT